MSTAAIKEPKAAKAKQSDKASAKVARRAPQRRAATKRQSAIVEVQPTPSPAVASIDSTDMPPDPNLDLAVDQPPAPDDVANSERKPNSVAPPTHTLPEILEELADRANSGERGGLIQLRKFLDEHPEAWTTVGNLGRQAEQIWIDMIASHDQLMIESIKRQLASMKEQLAGSHPTVIEKLLIDQVACAWLALKHAEIQLPKTGDTSKQGTLLLKRAESAQRRYLGAIKMLTTLRARLLRGLAPLNASVKLHQMA